LEGRKESRGGMKSKEDVNEKIKISLFAGYGLLSMHARFCAKWFFLFDDYNKNKIDTTRWEGGTNL
jgi:hypothetical protein